MILYKIILYLLTDVLNLVLCNENVLQKSIRRSNYSTVECISNILTSKFECGTLITFVNPNRNMHVDRLIEDANGDYVCYSIVIRAFQDRSWFTWTRVYIITAENYHELQSGMLDLTRDVFWNPRARFIIQLKQLNVDKEIRQVFQLMLKYRIFKVIIIHATENDATMYSYSPFGYKNCGKQFDGVITLGTCENGKNIDYFAKEHSRVLKNCTLKVVATDDIPNFISTSSNYTVYGKYISGLEQYVLDTIASREGFFIDYQTFDDDKEFNGIVLPNRTSTGLLSFVDRGKADLAAGGYVLMKNRVELFDYLYGFNYASYYLYTPAIGNRVWQRVYREFGLSTWLLFGAATILVIIVCLFFKRVLNDSTCSILNMWGYLFGNANAGISRHRSFRMIVFWWSWFTFFISSFYNTASVSLTSVHVRETPHPISAANLQSLPYKPCISNNSRMFFQFAFNQILPEGDPIHNCTYTDGALEYVASTKNHYTIEMEYSYSLKEYEYLDRDGAPKLESWLFSSSNIIVMYLLKGFPFRNRFQNYANIMYESGLIQNHLKTIHLRNFKAIKVHPKPFRRINMAGLRMHFIILASGYLLSFICFLSEIWYHQRQVAAKRK